MITTRVQDVALMKEMLVFMKDCYDESGLFTTAYDEDSVRQSLEAYIYNDIYHVQMVTNEEGLILGMFILVIIPEFINFNSKACVEFTWRPNPKIDVRSKVKVMKLMLEQMEEISLKETGKYPQFHLENNNDVYKHLLKRGYIQNEIVLVKE